MKTNLLRTVCVSAVLAAGGLSVFADDKPVDGTKEKEKAWTGTVTEVDVGEKIVKAKGFLLNRTFNVADNCAFSVSDKKDAALGDIRRGHKVNFLYKDVNGVLVASRMSQEELNFKGAVKDIDPKARTLTVNHSGSSKAFRIA